MSEFITKAHLLRFLEKYPDNTKIQVAASITLGENWEWDFPDELNVISMNSYDRNNERMIVLGFDGKIPSQEEFDRVSNELEQRQRQRDRQS